MDLSRKLKNIFLGTLIILFSGNCNGQKNKRQEVVNLFLEKARSRDVKMFYGLVLVPRKYNSNTNEYELSRLVAEFSIQENREQINLPIIKEGMTDNEIDSLPFSYGIEKLSLKKDIEIDSAKKYIINVVSLYRELKVMEIISHPDLGEFIRFKLGAQVELIYKERLGKVYNNYWKEYFHTASSIGGNWYIKE